MSEWDRSGADLMADSGFELSLHHKGSRLPLPVGFVVVCVGAVCVCCMGSLNVGDAILGLLGGGAIALPGAF